MSELGWKYLTEDDKNTILRGIRDGVAYGGPYHVEIHPADRCNIDCFFCSTAALRGTDEVPLTRLEEMIAELKACGTRAIRLSGGGEPLFHRKAKDFLRTIAASGIPIENLTTNAVLLSSYLFGCHTLRHLAGGAFDQLSRRPFAIRTYACVSCLNRRHMMWAWCSLCSVGFADLYVRLCSMGVWSDLRIF